MPYTLDSFHSLNIQLPSLLESFCIGVFDTSYISGVMVNNMVNLPGFVVVVVVVVVVGSVGSVVVVVGGVGSVVVVVGVCVAKTKYMEYNNTVKSTKVKTSKK